MKKLFTIFFTCMLLLSCATTNSGNNDELNVESYQQSIDNVINSNDPFKDFTDSNPKINTSDIGALVQADLYFNQGDYVNALKLYEPLAYKYKVPGLIYKAILCYKLSGITRLKGDKLSSGLVVLLEKTAPTAKVTRLLQIKQSLYDGNVALAIQALDKLIKDNPDNASNYLKFLSSLIGGVAPQNKEDLDRFAGYILNKYKQYPESFLLASKLYATVNNINKLNQTLTVIKDKFKVWYIPLFWSAEILSANGQYKSVVDITIPYIINNPQPDWNIQNIYIGALINNDQINDALNYLIKQAKVNDDANVELNFGILYAINKDYKNTASHLEQVKVENKILTNMVTVLIGLSYDMQDDYKTAVKYYEKDFANVYMESIANILLINDYNKLHNTAKIDQFISQAIKNKKLTGMNAVLYKANTYISIGDYEHAYNALNQNYSLYKKEKKYVYLYASVLAVTNRTNDAIKTYNYYIKLDPKSAYGYNDLAYVYAEQTTDYKTALKLAKKAAAIDISDYNIMDTLGWVYYKMGDYTSAYPLINSSYQALRTKDSAEHLKAVLIALNKPKIADKIKFIDKDTVNRQITATLFDKILGILMLFQYSTINSNGA